nr:movement protein [Carrot polerovirus 2]
MDLQRDPEESNPWLLSTHLRGAHVDVFNQSKSLWLQPLQLDEEDEEGGDAVSVTHEQLADPETESYGNSSLFRKTVSRATPLGASPSARIYQSTQLSAKEYSHRTMNIRSQTCEYIISRKPHLPQPVQSLMSWTHTVNRPNLRVESSSLESQTGSSRRL